MEENNTNEIILYQPVSTLTLDVRVEDDTVWLTQMQMAELFNATKQKYKFAYFKYLQRGRADKNVNCQGILDSSKRGVTIRQKINRLL